MCFRQLVISLHSAELYYHPLISSCVRTFLIGVLHQRPWLRRISHHEDERGTKRQGVRTPMMRCAVSVGVGQSSGYDFSIPILLQYTGVLSWPRWWGAVPDCVGESSGGGVGEDFSIPIIQLQCTGASLNEVSYGVGGMKDAGPIHCHWLNSWTLIHLFPKTPPSSPLKI